MKLFKTRKLIFLMFCLELAACGQIGAQLHSSVEESSLQACASDFVTTGPCKVEESGQVVTDQIGLPITAWNNPTASTTVTANIPTGYYYNQSVSFSDPSLLAANIVNGITIFGVTGTASLSGGAYAPCTDDAINSGQCSTASGRYVTATLGSNVTGSNGNSSITIPKGFYSGATTAVASDTNLIASNIRSGTTVFGVTGSLAVAYAACSDNGLNSSQCSTALNRYVTGTLGANITGSNAQLQITVPQGFYPGTTTATATDSNLTASNIKSGTTIFGVTGSAPEPYANCTDNGLNSTPCSTVANRYVASGAGANVGISGSTSATIPQGYYSGSQTCSVSDANLVPGNIRFGVSILGVTGMLSTAAASNMHRDRTTVQKSQAEESVAESGTAYTNASSGYRAVPNPNKDDDGVDGSNVIVVNRSTWASKTCGTSQTTIEDRISDCASVMGAEATWDGSLKGNAGQGVWRLVSRTSVTNAFRGAANEVWRDERTKLLWSSVVAENLSWCKASGSNSIPGNPAAAADPGSVCGNGSYQNTSGKAISACFEDDGTYFTSVDGNINNGGKANLNLSSTPKVAWRLPTVYDYQQANVNGIRFVLPDIANSSYNNEWSATVYSDYKAYGWLFSGWDALFSYNHRREFYGVRCIGR